MRGRERRIMRGEKIEMEREDFPNQQFKQREREREKLLIKRNKACCSLCWRENSNR